MGIIIRWLCWPSVSVSAVMAPASGELQDTAVREASVLVWHISKHWNETNPFSKLPITGTLFHQRRTCTTNNRDLFIQTVSPTSLFSSSLFSTLFAQDCYIHNTSSFSWEMTTAHLFPPPSLSRNGSVNCLRTPATLRKTWTECEQLPDFDSWLN